VTEPGVAEVAAPASPWAAWARHVLEMVVMMMAGMMVLSVPVAAIAGALGHPSFSAEMPLLATVLMAAEMAVPMALWMAYRGHPRRSLVEMSGVMLAPAAVLVAAASAGLTSQEAAAGLYHPAMLVLMVGYMLLRRREYAGHA